MQRAENGREFALAYAAAGIATPYGFQDTAWKHIVHGRNTLIATATGSGKTEAALLPALETGKRIVALYPTKALLQEQKIRVERLAGGRTIAVDTGDENDGSFYHADVILSSLDKFLYRFFGYGKRRWSYLFPYRIAFAGDRQPLLILDEAHAYDSVAFSHFWFLLKKLTYERRVQTVLLSATLPAGLVDALEDLSRRFFPRAPTEGLFFQKVEDQQMRSGFVIYRGSLGRSDIVKEALSLFEQGRRVIIVLDRVVGPRDGRRRDERTLQEVWQALSLETSRCATHRATQPEIARLQGDEIVGNVLTYHGHQMPAYRRKVLRRLEMLDDGWKFNEDGNPRDPKPFILLTTAALEVGVNISSDVMISDPCEPDRFVQRIGRCGRRQGETGEVYLIADKADPVSQRSKLLLGFMEALPIGSQIDWQVKQQLNDLNGQDIVRDLGRIHLRLEYLQDQSLYRYVYDFVQENQELWQKGVVMTREWEPSVPLVRSEQQNGQDQIGGIPARDFWRGKDIKEKILIPLSAAADLAPYCAWIFDGFNDGNQQTQRVAVGGSKERSLVEALQFAGLSPRRQQGNSNKVFPIYGLGVPVVLVLGSPQRDMGASATSRESWPFVDPNLGLSYHSQYARPDEEPKVTSPSPLLRVRKVTLRKGKRAGKRVSWTYELPLYWYEPNQERADGEGGWQ